VKRRSTWGIVLSALLLAGSGVAWADAVVRVHLNGTTLEFDGADARLTPDGVMVPLRRISEALGALVVWDGDNTTANLYKPNVHLLVAEDVSREGDGYVIRRPFGRIESGLQKKFSVLVQVDNLKTNLESFRVRVVDPKGETVGDSRDLSAAGVKDNFWVRSDFQISFNRKGEYRVQFLAKLPGGSYATLSEKAIVAE